MKDQGLISVIVPVYNVEQYIEKGITSLLGQSYTNLEIILVDDGSTDRSGEICDEYAGRDERIKVFHVPNGGQSTARNVGLSHAIGDFIGFMDSDDYVEATMYEQMINVMSEYDAGIVECDFDGRKIPAPERDRLDRVTVMSGYDAIKRQLDIRQKGQFPSSSVWSNLFKREVIEGLRFPEGKIHEEFAYLCEAFLRTRQYVYVNEIYYHRTLREDSTTAMKFTLRAFDKVDVYRIRNQFLEEQNETELLELSKEQEYVLLLHYYGESVKNGMKEKEKETEAYLLENKAKINVDALPKDKGRRFKLFFFSPSLYRTLIKMKA